MLPFLRESYGNANSLHSLGAQAREAVEDARVQVAELIGAEDPSQVFFTSGATEANNWIARSTQSGLISPFEHSSLIEPAQANGWKLWANSGGDLLPETEPVQIASLMAVNNEVGTLWDVRGESVTARSLHVDATQIVGKLPFSVDGLAYASMSAHKLYGPKGIGALFSAGTPPEAMILGGEQEHGFRSGTLNVPAIVGFGAAAELAQEEMKENETRIRELNLLFLDEMSAVSDWMVVGGAKTSPFILGLSLIGVEGESLVIDVDHRGYAISSGAACSSRSIEPSHVLRALGLSESETRGMVRISFGRANSLDSTAGLARTLAQSVEMVRTMTGG